MRRVRLLRRVRSERGIALDERGIALVMALGVMTVLGIAGTTIVVYSSSNYRSAAHSKSDQTAFSLAEAGINNAVAVLSLPTNNALDPDLLPPPPPSANARVDPYDGGKVTWGGTLDRSTAVWSLTSVGSVRNPTGAASVTRRMTAKVPVIPTYAQPLNNPVWNYMFATKTGTECDMTINNNVSGGSRLYVYGNLCLRNNAVVSPSALVVRGNLGLDNGSAIGGAASMETRVETYVGGGCHYGNATGPFNTPCPGDPDHVYSKKNPPSYVVGVNSNPVLIEPPTVRWDYWYENAIPGPAQQGCTTSSGTIPTFDTNYPIRNNSVTTVFELTPASSYSCRVGPSGKPTGELTWNAATRTLTVAGTIFIDGSAAITNGTLNQYNGQATLYLSGTFLVNGKLCGAVSGSGCDVAAWNPNTEMLTIVANGNGGQVDAGDSIDLTNGSSYQGGLYATNAIGLKNNSVSDGPMVGSTIKIYNNVTTSAFANVTTVPAGMPGNPSVYAQPNPPELFSG